MWRKAVSSDPWEVAEAAIVCLVVVALGTLASAARWGWVTASAVAACATTSCAVSILVKRRHHAARVRRHSSEGLRRLEAMLVVAATVPGHTTDAERGEE